MNFIWFKYLPRSLKNKIDGRYSLLAIIDNSGWLFADKILRMVVALFVGVWVARYLGPERFGQLNYAVAFVSMFSAIALLGLDAAVIREFIRQPDKKHEILGTVFVLKLFSGCLAFITAFGIAWFFRKPNDDISIWLIGIISLGLFLQAFDVIDILFQSQMKAKYTVYVKSTIFLSIAALKIVLILNNADIVMFAWVSFAEIALGAIGLLTAYFFIDNNFRSINVKWSLAFRLFCDSWPILISSTFVLMTMQLDKIILGEMKGSNEVGLYSVAVNLSSLWYMVPVVLGTSIAPALNRTFEDFRQQYYAKLQKAYTVLTMIALIVAIVVSFLSYGIINMLYGERYVGASEILTIHIWGAIFVFHVSIRTRAFIIESKQKYIMLVAGFTFITNVILNVLLIRNYGALGAAYASFISWFLCATFFPLLCKQTRTAPVMLLKSFLPIINL